jgi:hypothetical protein
MKMPENVDYDIIQREKDFGKSSRYFRYSTSNIPHPDKVEKGGEDAYLA